ncbi:hypothetical protein COCCADRAFT_21676 [Bipolaris zeicola 26-R-13]|uniref:Uncharacterized protein n=1 Tax=Cochliobolus carbonum (strain 26-R-13) TaxID=930089 RepID=W6YU28_COCC2|nr:uncharacterized protein COCCADRAFT_21676 [Bipolaris zeicola 26-R-13]EUC38924.1 hypothetical protein COCCADRAFT_21676 [Bipolaris zeicola 26-R-13]
MSNLRLSPERSSFSLSAHTTANAFFLMRRPIATPAPNLLTANAHDLWCPYSIPQPSHSHHAKSLSKLEGKKNKKQERRERRKKRHDERRVVSREVGKGSRWGPDGPFLPLGL